jgi:hypothetical protein
MPPPRNQPPGCFWAFFLILGLAIFAIFALGMILPAARARFVFVETRCTVLDKRLGAGNDNSWRPEIRIEYQADGRRHDTWTYDAAGVYSNDRAAKEAILAGFIQGRQYPCWYDPADPDRAVLVRDLKWWMLMALIPLVFVVVGIAGLIAGRRRRAEQLRVQVSLPAGTAKTFGTLGLTALVGFAVAAVVAFALFFALARAGAPPWVLRVGSFAPVVVFFIAVVVLGRRVLAGWVQRLPSPERRAAKEAAVGSAVRTEAVGSAGRTEEATHTRPHSGPYGPERTARQKHTTPAAPAAEEWPAVPTLELAPEPATTLAVRLRQDSQKLGCAVAFLIPFTTIWVSVVSAFVVHLARQHALGQHNWGKTFFLVPFVLVGLGLIVLLCAAAAGLIGRLLTGRVAVELSAHPLEAGGRYEVWAEQGAGAVPLRAVRVRLVCRESARYQQGTSTYTSTREVYGQDVLSPETNPRGDGLSGGVRRPLEVPAGVMHSFAAANNQVSWFVQVRGRVGLLPLRLAFPVVVYPAGGERHESA